MAVVFKAIAPRVGVLDLTALECEIFRTIVDRVLLLTAIIKAMEVLKVLVELIPSFLSM